LLAKSLNAVFGMLNGNKMFENLQLTLNLQRSSQNFAKIKIVPSKIIISVFKI
jgi:hypothetical protein